MSLRDNKDEDWTTLYTAVSELLGFLGKREEQINTPHGYLYIMDPEELDQRVEKVEAAMPPPVVQPIKVELKGQGVRPAHQVGPAKG